MELFVRVLGDSRLESIKRFYASGYYPAIVALLAVLSFCTQCDILFVSIALLLTAAGLLVASDLKPLMPMMLYFCFFICLSHSPSEQATMNPAYPENGGSRYYLRPEAWIPLLVFGLILVAAYAVNAKRTGHLYRVFTKRTGLLLWSLPLAITLLCNGIGSPIYTPKNLLIGFLTAFCWIFLYLLYYHGLEKSHETFLFFLKCCAFAAAALILQLLYVYLTYREQIFLPDKLNIVPLRFGWGIKNNFGGMMALLLPSCFYLAAKEKRGWLYYLLGVLSYAAIVMSFSRSALLVGTCLFLLCLVTMCCVGHHKKSSSVFLFLVLVGGALFLYFSLRNGGSVLAHYINKAFDDSARFELWKSGFEQFREQPFFGIGVYGIRFDSWSGIGMPGYLHNTPLQLLASGGLLCFLAYFLYRARTVHLFLKKMTLERLFLGLMLAALLGTSLLDNHMFNIYPAFYYAIILALAEHDYEEKTHTL